MAIIRSIIPPMLEHWFPNLDFEIPWEDFQRLPRHPAFRYEFRNGRTSLGGNPQYFHCLLDLSGVTQIDRQSPTDDDVRNSRDQIRPLKESDWVELPEIFAGSFSHSVPFAQLTDERRLAVGCELMNRTRAGGDGPLVNEACFVICDDENDLRGAILITLVPDADLTDFATSDWAQTPPPDAAQSGWGRPHLTWIFVKPDSTRRGVGAALLQTAADALRLLGYSSLASTLLLGQHASMLWHWRMGFELLSHPASPGRTQSTRPDARHEIPISITNEKSPILNDKFWSTSGG